MRKVFRHEQAPPEANRARQDESNDMDIGVILRRFESPDEVREMTLGRFEVIRLGG